MFDNCLDILLYRVFYVVVICIIIVWILFYCIDLYMVGSMINNCLDISILYRLLYGKMV